MGYDEFPTYYSDYTPPECSDCGCALDDEAAWIDGDCDCEHHH